MGEAKNLRQRRRQLEERQRMLAKEVRELKERVKGFTERRFLNSGEELECRTLQRVKLFKKDQLQALEKDLRGIDSALVEERAL